MKVNSALTRSINPIQTPPGLNFTTRVVLQQPHHCLFSRGFPAVPCWSERPKIHNLFFLCSSAKISISRIILQTSSSGPEHSPNDKMVST